MHRIRKSPYRIRLCMLCKRGTARGCCSRYLAAAAAAAAAHLFLTAFVRFIRFILLLRSASCLQRHL